MTFRGKILLVGVATILSLAGLLLLTNLTLVQGLDLAPRAKARIAFAVLATAVAAASVFFLLVHRLASDLDRRARTVERAALRLALGETPGEIPEGPLDEIGALERAFNRMMRERRAAEDLLLSRERLAAAGQMAAGVAHELGAPMTEILALSHLLREKGGADKAVLEEMIAAAERARKSLRDLVEMARPLAVEVAPIEIRPVCEEALARLRKTLGKNAPSVAILSAGDTGDDPAGPRALVDAARLADALFNLLRNSAEALAGPPPGASPAEAGAGTRAWEAPRAREAPRASIRIHLAENPPRIHVEDDGPGLSPKVRARLFEPFGTGGRAAGKEGGTGLGLWMTKQIIEAMGGTIAVSPPRAEGGAEFQIRLRSVG